MTPYDYLRKYRELSVRLVSGGIVSGVDVHEYRNAQDVFDKRNTDSDTTNDVDHISADHDAGLGWTKGWAALRGRIAKHGKKLGGGKYTLRFPLPSKTNPTPAVTYEETVNAPELAQAFVGKGSQEIIAQALRLAEAFGLVLGNAAAMQTYCDDFIGLDCNGYVGNYLKQEGCTLVTPTTPAKPNDFLPVGRRHSKLEEVGYRSVIVWKTAGHVAIIDLVQGPVLVGPKYDTTIVRCMVCESTGARLDNKNVHTDGLNYTLYEIHPPDKNKVFKVKRGLGGGGLSEVYIGKLM